jgi:hypothetical protein
MGGSTVVSSGFQISVIIYAHPYLDSALGRSLPHESILYCSMGALAKTKKSYPDDDIA